MKPTSYLIAGALALFTAGCASTEVADSADVNQEKIYQDYSVNIDAESGMSKATAQFRFGGSLGTTLDLSSPANVSCNGTDMSGEKEFLLGHIYSMKIDPSNPDYTFVYTNNDETVFTNSISISAISLANVPDQIDAKVGAEISWNGAELGNNETVTVTVSNDSGTALSSTSTMGATSVSISPDNLEILKGGPCTIYLTRSISKSCDESAEEGGNISASYTSEYKSVEVVGAEPVQ